jgi:hypothetical protein
MAIIIKQIEEVGDKKYILIGCTHEKMIVCDEQGGIRTMPISVEYRVFSIDEKSPQVVLGQ